MIATQNGHVINIVVTAAKSRAVSVFLSLWCAGVATAYTFMVVSMIRSGITPVWLLPPTAFAGAMVSYAASLMRWNSKGKEAISVSNEGVSYQRTFHPMGRRQKNIVGKPGIFTMWRPYQRKQAQLDYEFYGVGPWSLGLQAASGKPLELLSRLTKPEVCYVGEKLRQAGYEVRDLGEAI